MPYKKSEPVSRAGKEGKPMATEEKKYTKVMVPFEGMKYTLEFNSRVVKNMERRGFQLDMEHPYTCVEDLFVGALQMHHKGVTPERAKAIWAAQSKKDELLSVLVKLYAMPFEDLMKDPEGTEENADPTWETV